ncbi:molybdopterin-dependent oxidoreductase [Terriglobus saanensis]|uniref:Oxidoreductase molybdopterin binding protein n=1 Tax=Terriglobus saanensis (strain ATCC BAA-1853 / DSM 23119 / SP1PR4) TaxID=401053 RepID=E8V0J6_TERSS|nr:molybdopterin-dependent oxidoreductase [Terriglobus saanensis]ADV84479.1 oxidoreductase molybdopterin binding protein [Terriglobus saanensis SP1PR4]
MNDQDQSPEEKSTPHVAPVDTESTASGPARDASVSDEAKVSTSSDEKPALPEPDELEPKELAVEVDPQPKPDSDFESESKARLDEGDATVLAASRKHTRRSFFVAAGGAAAGYGLYRWIDQSPGDEMQPEPFRRTFQANATVAREVFRDHALTPTYPLKAARDLRVNGVYGLKSMLKAESWRLQLVGSRHDAAHLRFTSDVTAWEYKYLNADTHEDQGHDTKIDPNIKTAEKMAPEPMLNQARAQEERTGRMPRGTEEAGESDSTLQAGTPGLLLTMEDILKLPRHELITQFKCIEGWSQIVQWAGVRMADFMEAYPPKSIGGRVPKYVYMETPDGDYYTGYDLDVCRHPQTLLVTEMMGAPLTQFHGAPLRLHMPTKYGYKQIKRIGLISYTNQKPDDYWTKLGYDWDAGL